MTFSSGKVGFGVAAGVAMLLVGVSAGILVAPQVAPESLAVAPALSTVPVTDSEFRDPRVVELRIDAESDIPITAVVGGRVTEVHCNSSDPFVSGSSNFAIDGVRLVNLATRVPLWRDLKVGDRGDDVSALQEELSRLGQAVPVSGRVGRDTVAAASAVAQAAGSPTFTAGVIGVSRFVWIPSTSTSIAECQATLGDFFGSGSSIASARAPGSAAVSLMPNGLVAGARVVLVDGVEVAVDDAGVIVEQSSIDVLRQTSSYLSARESSSTGPIVVAGSLRLAESTTVSGVPPSSLVIGADASCVFEQVGDSAEAREVDVVGSLLGQSLVTFVGPPPKEVIVDPGLDECN